MTQDAFGKSIPVLPSQDIERALSFYASVLGFKTHRFEGNGYGIAVRGGTEIHFWACDDRRIAENSSCYLRVPDVRAVHAELSPKLPGLGDVVITAWGMDELYVIDPDGNLLKFGQERDGE
ncbi:bleomycin resistance protein [Herbaspirillum robiniae]|uniref:Bleomycin resistance protein n=1 Tax=Herbaspirillum robiniae TaxID=2014887 RepID=A0A246WQ12_9BURK|nr:VOC family protein [Herbaspirillum robiniae]OWY28469.1 glyoxalase [Herbaspirillum robiniae]